MTEFNVENTKILASAHCRILCGLFDDLATKLCSELTNTQDEAQEQYQHDLVAFLHDLHAKVSLVQSSAELAIHAFRPERGDAQVEAEYRAVCATTDAVWKIIFEAALQVRSEVG